MRFIRHEPCDTGILVQDGATQLECKVCREVLDYAQMTGEEIEIPEPFSKRPLECGSILLKPTNGTFREYQIGEEMHIGVMDSTRHVWSYWYEGMVREEASSWENAISACNLLPFFFGNKTLLNTSLARFLQDEAVQRKFTRANYKHNGLNCSTFIMDFLKSINYRQYGMKEFVREFICKEFKAMRSYWIFLDIFDLPVYLEWPKILSMQELLTVI